MVIAVPNAATQDIFDPISGRLLVENNAGAQPQRTYVYLNGIPIALVSGFSSIDYVLSDQLGQPQKLVDGFSTLVWDRVSDAFGATAAQAKGASTAVRFAEVCVLVVDATQLLEKQDLTIAREIAEEGRAIVLAVNKWDLVADKREKLKDLRDALETGVAQLAGVAAVTLSAKTGASIDKLMPAVLEAYEVWNRRIPTSQLNRWLEEAQARNPPPLVAGRRLRLRSMTQANIRPPTFALFASKPGDLPESYRRYLTNQLRTSFDLPGVPIRMMLRKGKNPYEDKRG